VDTPGYLPGTQQEHHGIIRHGAKVLYAYAEATVPKSALSCARSVRRRLHCAGVAATWLRQSAGVAVGADCGDGTGTGSKDYFQKEIAESKDPKTAEKEKVQELKEAFFDPMQAAKLGQIDMIINPKDTRLMLMKCLEPLLTKREGKVARKHGNVPL